MQHATAKLRSSPGNSTSNHPEQDYEADCESLYDGDENDDRQPFEDFLENDEATSANVSLRSSFGHQTDEADNVFTPDEIFCGTDVEFICSDGETILSSVHADSDTESDVDSDCENEFEDAFISMGDETIHPNLSFKTVDAVLLILSYFIRHNLTWTALSNMLILFDVMLGDQSTLRKQNICSRKYSVRIAKHNFISTVESAACTSVHWSSSTICRIYSVALIVNVHSR